MKKQFFYAAFMVFSLCMVCEFVCMQAVAWNQKTRRYEIKRIPSNYEHVKKMFDDQWRACDSRFQEHQKQSDQVSSLGQQQRNIDSYTAQLQIIEMRRAMKRAFQRRYGS